MGYQDFISQPEAAALAGVSESTLLRFAEAGYIRVEADGDGLSLFCKSQIADVFGIKQSKRTLRTHSPTTINLNSKIEKVEESPVKRVVSTFEVPAETEVVEIDETQNAGPKSEGSVVPDSQSASHTSVKEDKESVSKLTTNASESVSIELRLELERLRHVGTMLEKLLEAKDNELVATRKERDWLRTRVERMEEKADRDQLLLMSETQMLRKLLEEKASHRSALRTALEWIGLAEPQKDLSKRVSIDSGRFRGDGN
jgi:hypothetical protein